MSTHTGPREWDADLYDRVSDIQLAWGLEVLERLPLDGDETVLDAGCGSGRVTEHLAERVPRGRLLAVDASDGMVEKARERLGERARVWQADLAELELEAPVDAVFSNAVFHWIPDHDALFAHVASGLRPGGRLVAQCGGEGNVAEVTEAIRDVATEERFGGHLADFEGIWNFASAEKTAERLSRAGFEEVETGLEEKLVRPEEPLFFLRAVTLGPHLARLPEPLQAPFIEAVAERLGDPLEMRYVRLNISARRG